MLQSGELCNAVPIKERICKFFITKMNDLWCSNRKDFSNFALIIQDETDLKKIKVKL